MRGLEVFVASDTVLDAADFVNPDSPTLGLQDAIDALPEDGGTVLVPEGIWALRRGLTVPSHVTLRGSGPKTVLTRTAHVASRLLQTARAGDQLLQVASTEGICPGDELSLFAYGVEPVRVVVEAVEPTTLHLREPLAAGEYPIHLTAQVVNYFPLVRTEGRPDQPVSGVVIEDLTLDGALIAGNTAWRTVAPPLVHVQGAADSIVRRCVVQNAFGGGIQVDHGHDNRIEDNRVERVRGHGIVLLASADSAVCANTVRWSGFESEKTWGNGIMVLDSADARVEKNVVELSCGDGLHSGAAEAQRDGFWAYNVSRANGKDGFYFCWNNWHTVLADNTLLGNARCGIGGLGAGGQRGDRLNIVVRNTLLANGSAGIALDGGSLNVVRDNTVSGNSRAAPGRSSGILLQNTVHARVLFNRSSDEPPDNTQRFGIQELGASDLNLIVGNWCEPNEEGGILYVGWRTRVWENTGTVCGP